MSRRWWRDFMQANPEVTVNLDLSDRLVDLLNENIDCAIRIGELTDSSLVSVRLGEMRRMVVASPAYLVAHGVPREPADLARTTACRLASSAAGCFAIRDGEVDTLKVSGTFECNDGAVLHEWALAGRGLAWRSLWEVGQDLKEGALTSVLDAWQAPPMGIYAVFPQRRHLPLRVRLFIDLLKETYSRPSYWELRAYKSDEKTGLSRARFLSVALGASAPAAALPTTPFLILAAYFFARSHPEWEARCWLIPQVGP
jgi:DNA-binding transcriptional LysR family regulator